MIDQIANFAWGTIATDGAADPPSSGTELTLTENHGDRFPDPAGGTYEIVVKPAGAMPLLSNSEIMLVTARTGDTLTVTRQQAGTSARAIQDGDEVYMFWGKTQVDQVRSEIADVESDLSGILTSSLSALNSHETETTTHGVTGDLVGTEGAQEIQGKTYVNPTFSGDGNMTGTNPNWTVNGADPLRTLGLPASAFSPATTSPCSFPTTVEAGTNDVDYRVLDFDQTTPEYAFIMFPMPVSWDGGTFTIQPIWTAASGTGDVLWKFMARAFANDDAIDQAYGTAQSSLDTLITVGDIHFGPFSSAITLAGTPAGGQLVQLKIYRDAGDGTDTLNADARLIGIVIKYKVGQYSD